MWACSYGTALLYRSGTRLMGIILPYILYGKRTEDFFWRYGLRAYMKDLLVSGGGRLLGSRTPSLSNAPIPIAPSVSST